MNDTEPLPEASRPPAPAAAVVLSVLFHPLLIPTYGYILLALTNPFLFGINSLTDGRGRVLLLMVFLYTFVIPVLSVFIMVKLEMVDSLLIEDRMQRIGPLLLVMILYFWVFYNLHQNNDSPAIFNIFMLGVVMALAISFAINVVEKLSLHAVGMGGLVGMVMILLGVYGNLSVGLTGLDVGIVLVLAVLLAGAVGTARLAMSAHTTGQLVTGYLVGFTSQWLALNFYF